VSSWQHVRGARLGYQGECDSKAWMFGHRPNPHKTDFSYCTRKIITDLSPQFTSPEEFKLILNFLKDTMAICFNKTNGHNFIMMSLNPMEESPYKEYVVYADYF
jgi:hypothetical protein